MKSIENVDCLKNWIKVVMQRSSV